MAETTCSVWKITHGTTVLLDYGDRLLGEPDFGFGKEVEVAPLLRGVHPGIFDRGNVQHDLSYARVVRKSIMAAGGVSDGGELKMNEGERIDNFFYNL